MKSSTIPGDLSIQQETETGLSTSKRRNWPLIVGVLLVAVILFLGIIGPKIAPRDPLEENNIIQIDGKWHIPPFDLGTSGFPLGSDEFGRDLFSRLLWGIQPTMAMVIIVALVRLIMGVWIGLLAGWAGGRTARLFDGLIQLATALPVLLVALGAIAVVGVELGIWAFIIGLSLTGWVDTAIQVREQTRIVKTQEFIEAARALGSSNSQILRQHILNQILPVLFMLFAFEVSNTLMATAGLGFLGYYIGGDVWVTVGDFIARRISGMPELGQMLATSWVSLTKPWAMVVAGTTIFVAILGFNLIGEGLRHNANIIRVRQKGLLIESWIRLRFWVDQNITHPLAQFIRIRNVRKAMLGISTFLVLGIAGYQVYQWLTSTAILQNSLAFVTSMPVSPLTTIESFVQPTQNPSAGSPESSSSPTEIASSEYAITGQNVIWSYQARADISYGPFINQNGYIFLINSIPELEILNPDGSQRASVSLNTYLFSPPEVSIDLPQTLADILDESMFIFIDQERVVRAFDTQGQEIWNYALDSNPTSFFRTEENRFVFLLDDQGGVYAFSSEGFRWYYQSEAARISAGGLAVGPDGSVYYTVTNRGRAFVEAVSKDGKGLWSVMAPTDNFYNELQISRDGNVLALTDVLINARTGEIIEVDPPLPVHEYLLGDDGGYYFRSLHTVIEFDLGSDGMEVVNTATLGDSGLNLRPPFFAHVDANSVIWLFYPQGTSFRNYDIVWLAKDGSLLGSHSVDLGEFGIWGHFLFEDYAKSQLIECSLISEDQTIQCSILAPGEERPVFQTEIHGAINLFRGTLNGDELYLFTSTDTLTKISLNR